MTFKPRINVKRTQLLVEQGKRRRIKKQDEAEIQAEAEAAAR